MRAAIYVRLSSAETQDPAADLAGQRAQAAEYVTSRGWDLAASFQDTGYSGTSRSRPGLQRLLEDAREGRIDSVVVSRLDRLMSGTEAMLALLEELASCGVQVHSAGEGLDTASEAGRNLLHVGRAALGQVPRHTYEPAAEAPPAVAPGEVILVERPREKPR